MKRGRLVADCPACKWVADEGGRVEVFRIDGITHAAQSMWLVGRTTHVDTLTALHQWADQCALRLRFEAQRARQVA